MQWIDRLCNIFDLNWCDASGFSAKPLEFPGNKSLFPCYFKTVDCQPNLCWFLLLLLQIINYSEKKLGVSFYFQHWFYVFLIKNYLNIKRGREWKCNGVASNIYGWLYIETCHIKVNTARNHFKWRWWRWFIRPFLPLTWHFNFAAAAAAENFQK